MKRWLLIVAIVMCGTAAALAQLATGPSVQPVQGKSGPLVRLLMGQVTSRDGNVLPKSVVYLKNTKTLMVKTFITGDDGSYRFPALSPNVDYEIFAEYDGKRSDTKTLSAFDTRQQVTIHLKIDVQP